MTVRGDQKCGQHVVVDERVETFTLDDTCALGCRVSGGVCLVGGGIGWSAGAQRHRGASDEQGAEHDRERDLRDQHRCLCALAGNEVDRLNSGASEHQMIECNRYRTRQPVPQQGSPIRGTRLAQTPSWREDQGRSMPTASWPPQRATRSPRPRRRCASPVYQRRTTMRPVRVRTRTRQ